MFSFTENDFKERIECFGELLKSTEVTHLNSILISKAMNSILKRMYETRESGNSIFLIGNGGSSAIASHIAVDFIKACGINSQVFTDASLMTCMGNDFGYEEIYAWPISRKIKKGDILISISSSGNSPNILRAVEEAKKKNAFVVTLSGFKKDNSLRTAGDYNFYVPSDSYRLVESAHDFILHQFFVSFYLKHLKEKESAKK